MLDEDGDERDRRRDDLDEVIVAALAAGRSYAEAAQLSGTSARTVRRRMSDVGFAAEVSARRGERVGELAGRLLGETQRALDVVIARLDSESESVQLKAAEMMLSWSVRLRSAHEQEQRLQALEAAPDGDASPATAPRNDSSDY